MGCALQIRSRSIVSYYKRDLLKKRFKSAYESIARQQSIEQFKQADTYTGKVTAGSQKRLTKALENLVQIAKPKKMLFEGKEYYFKLNFITLTLYEFGRKVPGKEAHKNCLEPLLKWMRDNYDMTAYVWKAELQSKREDCHQLHYHITTDVYVPYLELRNKWNELQRKAGYLDYFFEKFNYWNANSTDVHATHNKKNLVGYLKKSIVTYAYKKENRERYQQLRSKYLVAAEMTKAVQNEETIEGKVWDCSQNIKTSFFEVKDYFNITRRLADAVLLGEMEKKEFERCTVYELKKTSRSASSYLPWLERQFYNDHIEKMRNYKRLKPDITTFSTS